MDMQSTRWFDCQNCEDSHAFQPFQHLVRTNGHGYWLISRLYHSQTSSIVNHPHPDKLHVIKCVRTYILGNKRKFGTARSLVHHRDLIQTYLTAKRQLIGAENGVLCGV
jgi:hypothetical protein